MVINFNIEDTEYNFVSILSIIHIVYIYNGIFKTFN